MNECTAKAESKYAAEKARRRLEMAAPDMLAACKAALEFMVALDIERKVVSGLSLQLQAAIEKAEGDSHA